MSQFATDPFQEAEKERAKVRLALMGPSGSGKTWTALEIATQLAALEGGKIAFLDTEGKSSLLYSRHFNFRVMHLKNNYDPSLYVNAIRAAAQFGYAVIVIDSASPAWNGSGGVLEIVDKTGEKMGNNKWAGWSKGRPAQNGLINAIVNTPIHIIATMRSKTDWIQQENPRTRKMEPVKIGLAAVQSDDMEYEFTLAGMLDMDHRLTLTKSRFGNYPCGSIVESVNTFATDLYNWLGEGVETEELNLKIVGDGQEDPAESLKTIATEGEQGEVVEDPVDADGKPLPPPKGTWANAHTVASLLVTLRKENIEKQDIPTLLPVITNVDDPVLWNQHYETGRKAAEAVVAARDKRKAALGSQSAQPPVYGKPPSAPAGFSADDLTAIREACAAWYDPEMEMPLLPDVAAAAVGSLPFDWSKQFKTVKDAIQAITGYAQRRNLPMIVSRACYRQSGGNSYTALSNGQLTVRMYGRDRLRNLGADWPAIVDAGAIDQPYNLPQTIVVTWEDKGDYSLAREVRLLGTPVAKAALADTSHVGSLTSAGVAQELAAADANDAVDASKIPF